MARKWRLLLTPTIPAICLSRSAESEKVIETQDLLQGFLAILHDGEVVQGQMGNQPPQCIPPHGGTQSGGGFAQGDSALIAPIPSTLEIAVFRSQTASAKGCRDCAGAMTVIACVSGRQVRMEGRPGIRKLPNPRPLCGWRAALGVPESLVLFPHRPVAVGIERVVVGQLMGDRIRADHILNRKKSP